MLSVHQKAVIRFNLSLYSGSACTRTCGVGTKSRSRSEVVPASNGGQKCEGYAIEEENCGINDCPVDR